MEQTPDSNAELMKRLQEIGACMYHPMSQLVLFDPADYPEQEADHVSE